MGFEVSIIIFRCLWILQIQFSIKFQSPVWISEICVASKIMLSTLSMRSFFGGLWGFLGGFESGFTKHRTDSVLMPPENFLCLSPQGFFAAVKVCFVHQNWILNPLLYCAVPICNLLSPWKYRLIKIIQRTAHEGKTTRISHTSYLSFFLHRHYFG